MHAQQGFSLVIIAGSIIFLIAAFWPLSRVYAEADGAKKLAIIRASGRGWPISQLLFGLGAVLTAVGVGWLAVHFKAWPAYLSFLAFSTGAGLWCWTVYVRAANPEAFAAGTLPGWPFRAYTFLTQLGLALLGLLLIFLLGSRLPGWVGWLDLVGSGLLFVAYLVFKDMPPFVYYLLTLVTAVMLYLTG